MDGSGSIIINVEREGVMKEYMSVESMLEREPQKRHRYVRFLLYMTNRRNMEYLADHRE